MRTLIFCFCVFSAGAAAATPPGFVKWTIPLDAPPVGLAYGENGVLYALETAPFGSNVATMRTINPDGSFGTSFSVTGDETGSGGGQPNFFVGDMAYDTFAHRLLVTDNTADGRVYSIDELGNKQTLSTGLPGAAGIVARNTGEIFVTTSPFGSPGEVFQIDPASGAATSVLGGLGFGAGVAFDESGNLMVQDAHTSFPYLGRLQLLPITETQSGLVIGSPQPLLDNMQSSAGVLMAGSGPIFTTGSGGLYRVDGTPLIETVFDSNGSTSQFATAITFDPGTQPFDRFAGPNGGRLAYLADFGFASQDSFVTMLTPAEPGDYNGDGDVAADDYALWRGAFGTADAYTDGNGNGGADAADYVMWRAHAATQATAGLSGASGTNVPEPTASCLALVMLLTLNSRPRRRA